MNPTTPQLSGSMLPTLGAGYAYAHGLAFTTGRYLDAFEANPKAGDISMPVVGGDEVRLVRVGDGNSHHMRNAVQAVLEEGKAIRETAQGWDPGLWTSLESTGGRWGITEKDRGKGYVLRSSYGRHISFWDYRSTVGIGYSGSKATCYQNVYLEGDGRLHTLDYSIKFFRDGARSLARYLDMRDASMGELALAVANLIYSSMDSDSRDESYIPRIQTPKNEYEVKLQDGGIAIPSSIGVPGEEIHFYLDREEIEHVGATLPVVVGAYVDRLTVHIHRRHDRSERLMPLPSDLLPLWEGAKFLAMSDPDDGGYLAQII